MSNVAECCERHSDCVLIIAGDFNVNVDTRDAVASLIRQFAFKYSLVRCDDLFPQQKTSAYVKKHLGYLCCIARLERPACRHRFCTVTGHFQVALDDSYYLLNVRLSLVCK